MQKHFTVKTSDDVNLQGYSWEPEENKKVKAVMVIIHGLGEHMNRYHNLGKSFATHGIAVFGMDLRGHGNSPGKRGHTAPRSQILDDVDTLCRTTQAVFPDVPLFIYGHSMGGNIGLHHRLLGKFRPKGYIITSPWIILYNKISGIQVFALRLLSKIMPDLCIKNGLDTKNLSSDESQIDCSTDELYHQYVSIQTTLDCSDAALEILESSNNGLGDVLLLHGTDDHICSIDGSKAFMKNAPDSCTFIQWEGSYHELHHDKDREKVKETIKAWILDSRTRVTR